MTFKALWRGLAILVLLSSPALAAPREVRLPLYHGRLRTTDLSALLCRDLHLPAWRVNVGQVDFNGWKGSLFLASLNASLSDGCRVSVLDDELIFHFDTEKLPHDVDEAKHALRVFVASETPTATAAEARHLGLFLPPHVDSSKNLVILIHGMECDMNALQPMGDLLTAEGEQVGYFCYPGDAPLAEDVALLERHLAAVREAFPSMRLDFVGHSMGGLIARAYVEGADYQHDVDHLILVGTPNAGSTWTRFHFALKIQNQYESYRHDPDWHWSWFITEGLGEAARDVTPKSKFLRHLNALPRREGVRYTIVAGSHSATATAEAAWVEKAARWIPLTTRNWWVLGPMRLGMEREAEKLREQRGNGDGPVSLASAKLAGVKDMVIVPTDHCGLFYGTAEEPPAAFEVIRDRLRSK